MLLYTRPQKHTPFESLWLALTLCPLNTCWMNFPSSAVLELSQPIHTDFNLVKIACLLQEKGQTEWTTQLVIQEESKANWPRIWSCAPSTVLSSKPIYRNLKKTNKQTKNPKTLVWGLLVLWRVFQVPRKCLFLELCNKLAFFLIFFNFHISFIKLSVAFKYI